MNKRDITIYGGIIAGTALLTSALGLGAHKAGQVYRSMNPSSITSPAPDEAEKPKFDYVRNLSEEVFRAVRTLDSMYRTQHNRGLQVFHLDSENEHYVIVRGVADNTIAEAYLKASKWGVIDSNTPMRLVLGSTFAGIPKTPLLLAARGDVAYEELVDDKRHGTYRSVSSLQPLFPQAPEQEDMETLNRKVERGLETIIRAVEEETRRIAGKG